MGEKKVFVNDHDMATFICPKCQKVKVVNASPYKEVDKSIRVTNTCICGHTYSVILERRKFYRKEENLPGTCIFGPEKNKASITVKDLSHIGLKFRLTKEQDFEIGQKLMVIFHLNDAQKTLIEQEVIIKSIASLNIGTEFCNLDSDAPVFKAVTDYVFS